MVVMISCRCFTRRPLRRPALRPSRMCQQGLLVLRLCPAAVLPLRLQTALHLRHVTVRGQMAILISLGTPGLGGACVGSRIVHTETRQQRLNGKRFLKLTAMFRWADLSIAASLYTGSASVNRRGRLQCRRFSHTCCRAGVPDPRAAGEDLCPARHQSGTIFPPHTIASYLAHWLT